MKKDQGQLWKCPRLPCLQSRGATENVNIHMIWGLAGDARISGKWHLACVGLLTQSTYACELQRAVASRVP